MARAEFRCRSVVQFLPEQSELPGGPFAFAYTVTIENVGDVAAQLVARRWTITDAQGGVEQVRGLAVVGQQPLLRPGERFEYTSWTQLATEHGTMQGSYLCVTDQAEPFEAEVPEFALVRARALH